jgi:uncharacterized protein (TIGR02271 family)
MTQTTLSPEDLYGTSVTSQDGQKIGKVEEVYLDDDSGRPEWVSVKTGMFGSNTSLLPLSEADITEGTLVVPFAKDKVKGAPNQDPGQQLSRSDEDDLYRYYGIDASGGADVSDAAPRDASATSDAGIRTDAGDLTSGERGFGDRDATAHDEYTAAGRSEHSNSSSEGAVTRSKEELRVGTETRESGRARLRKHITTEDVTRSVPVSREEVTLTREPITDAERADALTGGDLSEEEHELVLTEERAVMTKETVPVERVKLGTETVKGTETVEARLAEEQVDVDGNQAASRNAEPDRAPEQY